MKINNKGYASTIIMFSILTLFLISMLMLVKTMNNSSSLNKKITDKVIDNIDYDASGSVQDRLSVLENKVSNLKSEVINEIYPVGSIYMSTEDDNVEKVQSKFGGKWEVYASGRTLVSAGTVTDANGETKLYSTSDESKEGGVLNVKLNTSNLPSHSHSIPSLTGSTSSNGSHTHNITLNMGYMDRNSVGGNWIAADQYFIIVGTGFSVIPGITSGVLTSYSNSYSGSHTHNITTNVSTSGVTGENKSFSVQNPYTVVYMYRRKE